MSGELLTTEQMSRADAFAIAAGVPSLTLMENAGRAVADVIAARFAPCRTTILCGPGNNGGDGFVVARLLAEKGFAVRIAFDAQPMGDAATMAAQWHGQTIKLSQVGLEGVELVVDALFGAGLSRPLEGSAHDAVLALNASGLPVVAIDVPSGLEGNSGRALGGVAVRANITVTFFRKKPGHLLLPGRDLCGAVLVADIGISADVLALLKPSQFENTPAQWGARFAWPQNDGHKYGRGHCVVVSGPLHATGAARLAARGALRAGAGLVSVASPPDAVTINAAHLTAIMIKPFSGAKGLAQLLSDPRLNAVVVGPGLGVSGETRELVSAVLASGRAAVLDADALTSFRDDPDALFARIVDPVVLTPHAGEFELLFPGLLQESASKLEATRAAARRAGAVVLLKGADTVIAAPDGTAFINANAPATLATAGAGDVLAGLIAGLLAQGMGAADAAAAGAWLHGDAAARFGPGLIAEDIPEILPESLSALRDSLRPSNPPQHLL